MSQKNDLVRKITWRRKWQPTPVFFSLKSHEQKSLEGYSPSRGCKRVGHDSNYAATATEEWLVIKVLIVETVPMMIKVSFSKLGKKLEIAIRNKYYKAAQIIKAHRRKIRGSCFGSYDLYHPIWQPMVMLLNFKFKSVEIK